jgi:hypothetical protein
VAAGRRTSPGPRVAEALPPEGNDPMTLPLLQDVRRPVVCPRQWPTPDSRARLTGLLGQVDRARKARLCRLWILAPEWRPSHGQWSLAHATPIRGIGGLPAVSTKRRHCGYTCIVNPGPTATANRTSRPRYRGRFASPCPASRPGTTMARCRCCRASGCCRPPPRWRWAGP